MSLLGRKFAKGRLGRGHRLTRERTAVDERAELHPKCATAVVRGGVVMAIIRPRNAPLAVSRAKMIHHMPKGAQAAAFDGMLGEQEYVFEGIAMKDGSIRDPRTGGSRGRVRPGDSFVPYRQLREHQAGEQRR